MCGGFFSLLPAGGPMTRSDIGVIAIIYATCLLFFYMTLQLKAAAQIYPLCLISGLAILNTLYLVRCWLRMAKTGRRSGSYSIINDFSEIFSGFQPRQFIFVATACIAYMFLLHWLGFYLAGAIYLIAVMLYLKVKPVQLTVTVIFLGVLVYGVFSLFLKVPLPKGILFS